MFFCIHNLRLKYSQPAFNMLPCTTPYSMLSLSFYLSHSPSSIHHHCSDQRKWWIYGRCAEVIPMVLLYFPYDSLSECFDFILTLMGVQDTPLLLPIFFSLLLLSSLNVCALSASVWNFSLWLIFPAYLRCRFPQAFASLMWKDLSVQVPCGEWRRHSS